MTSVQLVYLAPDAPKLNPVGFLWARFKGKALENYMPDTNAKLSEPVVASLPTTRARLPVPRGYLHSAVLPVMSVTILP